MPLDYEMLKITAAYESAMMETLLLTYFRDWDSNYFETDAGRSDINVHVTSRMLEFEDCVIPWIEDCFSIKDASILEIGCGTGCSTIPFALKAKQLDAYDISQSSIRAAERRAELMEADRVRFHLLDPTWSKSLETASLALETTQPVDIVLMLALLEHLTVDERIRIINVAFKILRPGGIMVIYETPNRLHYYDWHTFLMPFIGFLPDQLSISYALKSERKSILPDSEFQGDKLYALGRGVSFHEFELALDFREFGVINDGFSERLAPIRKILGMPTYYRAMLDIFNQHLPHIPLGFALPSLDLILYKHGPDLSLQLPIAANRIAPYRYGEQEQLEVDHSRIVRLALYLQETQFYKTLSKALRSL
jgi:2-polyprenyl-3-methyl-5-hydroxy-6-metoxy-1,4-benzoquinol methylase